VALLVLRVLAIVMSVWSLSMFWSAKRLKS
jgi:hypothetical protein